MTTHSIPQPNSPFSPGPWTAYDDDGTGTLPCVLSAHVNRGGNFYVAQSNVYEDARLIAAAPQLLEALKVILKKHPHIAEDGCGALARDAIAKAGA